MSASGARMSVDTPSSHREPGPVSYLSALRRWWWMPVLCAVAAATLAYMFAERGTPQYEATALLVIDDQDVYREILGLPGKTTGSPQLTISQVIPQVDQPRTARRARRELGLSRTATIEQVQDQTDVRPDQVTGTLAIVGTASEPELAAGLANAYAQAYVGLRDLDDRRQIRRAREAFEDELRAQTQNPDSEQDAADALSLSDRIRQLKLTEKLRPPSVSFARPASVPTAPSGPSGRTAALVGLLAGLLLGLALVVLRAHLDRRVRTTEDLSGVLQAPVLACVRGPRRRRRSRVPFLELDPAEAEPYRLLLARLRHGGDAGAVQSVAVTAGEEDADASRVAWNLAGAAAASGARTLLIDAVPTRSAGPSESGGLSAALAGHGHLLDLVDTPDGDRGLRPDVLAAGSPNGSRHLGEAEPVQRVLNDAAAEYDLIVVHTAPISSADAIPFARHAGGVVTVLRDESLTRAEAVRLRAKLEQINARVLGIVTVAGRRGAG